MNEPIEIKSGLEGLTEVANTVLKHTNTSQIIIFRGDLGAGKTTLIKKICTFLQVKDEVSSPTFSLVNEYLTHTNKSIYHFDFYRIENEEEALDMGYEDYFYSGNLCLVEWPEKIENILPSNHIEVTIEIIGDKRMFKIKQINYV